MSLTPRLDKLDKNYFINGGMDFHQRLGVGNYVALTGSNAYYADRWLSSYSGSWTVAPVTLSSPLTPNAKSKYSVNNYGQADNSSSSISIGQRIESLFASDLADETCSMSWWVKSETGFLSSAVVNFYYLATPDVPATATLFHTETIEFTADSTWRELKIEGVAFPSGCTGGAVVEIIYSGGTVFGGLQGIFTTQYCLNIGAKAIEFTRAGRTWQDELLLCQRYFEKSWELEDPITAITLIGSQPGHVTFLTSFSQSLSDVIPYKARKRVNAPSIIAFNPLTGAANWRFYESSGSATDFGVTININSARGFSVLAQSGNFAFFYGHWYSDAEL